MEKAQYHHTYCSYINIGSVYHTNLIIEQQSIFVDKCILFMVVKVNYEAIHSQALTFSQGNAKINKLYKLYPL